MFSFEAETADGAWRYLARRLQGVDKIQSGRNQPTRELLHAGFSITDPRQRVVAARAINPAFAIAEVIWILAGFDDIDWIAWWNARYRSLVADEKSPSSHGAYGSRLGSQPNITSENASKHRHRLRASGPQMDQLKAALRALEHDPNSRQVVLQIWDSSRDMPNPLPRSRDIPCNIMSHLLVRDGRLEWLQIMRSNDIMLGLPYNLIQFTTLQEILAGWLKIEVGTYTHLSSSLHVYEQHWKQFDELPLPDVDPVVNQSDLRIASYDQWERVWASLVECTEDLMGLERVSDLAQVPDRYSHLPSAYREWVAVLAAEAIRKKGDLIVAQQVIAAAGDYWGSSWNNWARAQTYRT